MRLLKVVILCGLFASAAVFAQERRTNPAALPPVNGYSHVVVAPPGQRVVISGQVALDAKGNLVGAARTTVDLAQKSGEEILAVAAPVMDNSMEASAASTFGERP
jgi:enamine deaminase RidA (YjgF/YER057c/UK114 family)